MTKFAKIFRRSGARKDLSPARRALIWWHRWHLLIFVSVCLGATFWVVYLWYKVSFTDIMTPQQANDIRLRNLGAEFNKERFDRVLERQKKRREIFEQITVSENIPDVFDPRRAETKNVPSEPTEEGPAKELEL